MTGKWEVIGVRILCLLLLWVRLVAVVVAVVKSKALCHLEKANHVNNTAKRLSDNLLLVTEHLLQISNQRNVTLNEQLCTNASN